MKNIPSKSRVAGYWMVWDIGHIFYLPTVDE